MKKILTISIPFLGLAILLILSDTGFCADIIKLNPIDKVVILEVYGDNNYPLGKSDAIVTRLGDTRATGKQYPPLAAHGMGVLVEITVKGKKRTMLFDTGDRGDVLCQNMSYFGKNPAEIEAIAISHAHSDHFGGLTDVLNLIRNQGNRQKMPIYVGSQNAFETQYFRREDGTLKGPWKWLREAAEIVGGEYIIGGPHLLLDGYALYTGPIPYSTDYEGINLNGKSGWCVKDNDNIKMIDMPEEAALVLNVANCGLVVISGCTHRGTVNTLRCAQQLTGIDKVYARYGSYPNADKDKLLKDLLSIKPAIFIGTHCSVDKPELMNAIKVTLSQNNMVYYQSVVGSEFQFSCRSSADL